MGISADLTIAAGMSDREAAQALIRRRAVAALERVGGNVSRAAQLLEVHRNTLTRRLQELDLGRLPGDLRRQKRLQLALNFPKPVRPERRSHPHVRRSSGKRLA